MEMLGEYSAGFQYVFLKKKAVLYTTVIAYTVFNLALVVLPPIPSQTMKPQRHDGYWLLVANIVVFSIGVLWWLGLTKGLNLLNIDVSFARPDHNTPECEEGIKRIFFYEVSKLKTYFK